MKIIAIDNFGRETEPDILIAENVNQQYIDYLLETLNDEYGGEYSTHYFTSVNDDYVLSKGMADLV